MGRYFHASFAAFYTQINIGTEDVCQMQGCMPGGSAQCMTRHMKARAQETRATDTDGGVDSRVQAKMETDPADGEG